MPSFALKRRGKYIKDFDPIFSVLTLVSLPQITCSLWRSALVSYLHSQLAHQSGHLKDETELGQRYPESIFFSEAS